MSCVGGSLHSSEYPSVFYDNGDYEEKPKEKKKLINSSDNLTINI